MRIAALCLLAFCCTLSARGQVRSAAADSLRRYDLAPVVVTATRSARALQDVPVPTTIVTGDAIRLQGAVRLSDLLAEQPGLQLVDGLGGTGLQVQGFDPDYTLILVDGEPVVGREGGLLDLDRLGVAGLERVEIVRGPTSSRYGSDALAGVVNLITRRPAEGLRGRVGLRYETFETSDARLSVEAGRDRWGLHLGGDRFASAGYDLDPNTTGQTSPAFTDYSADARLNAQLAEQTRLDVRAHAATRDQDGSFALGSTDYDETGRRREWSIAPSLTHRLSSHLRVEADAYAAGFRTLLNTAETATGAVLDRSRFRQGYQKGEAQLVATLGARHVVYAGGGAIRESVESDRYTRGRATWQGYGFGEYEWAARPWLDVTLSGRYDRHSEFGSRLTPKAALLVKPLPALRLRASVGSGFKTPDFRQRYLNFTNATAGGYSVFGAAEVLSRLDAFEAAGVRVAYNDKFRTLLGELRPEASVSLGAGVEYAFGDGITARLNGFYNSIHDLIETQQVAVLSDAGGSGEEGRAVFSYFNLNRVYTQGVEADVSAHLTGALHVGASYQLLDTADRDVLAALDAGKLYGRVDGRDRRLTRGDYGGLFGRSRHSGTARVTYASERLGLTGALRVVWRSRFGYDDANGNLILDSDAEYTPGYGVVHLTFTRPVGRAEVQAGVRNLFDYTTPVPEQAPSLAGRILFLGATLRL